MGKEKELRSCLMREEGEGVNSNGRGEGSFGVGSWGVVRRLEVEKGGFVGG